MREVKKEIEMLEKIFQIVSLTKDVFNRNLKIENIEINFENELKEIIAKYNKIISSVRGMLKNRHKEVKEISVGEKIATYVSIKLNIKSNEKQKNIANLLNQELEFNAEKIKKVINDYSKISKTIINLCSRIINVNEECRNILKKYI